MAIAMRSTKAQGFTGQLDISSTATTAVHVVPPADLAIGDTYVISAIYQSLTGAASFVTPAKFTLLNTPGTSANRLLVIFGRKINTSTDLAEVQDVPLVAGATATRVSAVTIAFTGVDSTAMINQIGDWVIGASGISSLTFPAAAGDYIISFAYTNTSAGTAPAVHSPVGGTYVTSATSKTDTGTTAASTVLSVLRNASGVSFTPAPANSGGFTLAMKAATTVTPPVEPAPDTPAPLPNYGPDVLSLAPASDVPVITFSALAASAVSTIANSPGWLREKRVGVAENVPGASQTSTADLDIDGSTRFRFPGVPSAVGTTSNAPQYVATPLKPGGAPQAAYWLFNLEFVLEGSNEVEIRLNAPLTSPTFGMVLVNGRRIQDTTIVATGMSGGYAAKLTFPTVERRVIKIIGLNNNQGRFGGVATGPGGLVRKTPRTITRRIAVIGDSFTNGAGTPPDGARANETYIWRLAMLMGADEVVQAGIGGTGWVTQVGALPESVFGGRIAAVLAMDPDVLIFSGGRNDANSTEVKAAVDAALAATTSVPERWVIATTTATQTVVFSQMQAGAFEAGVPFVDVDREALEIGSDGIHPTFAGHVALANQVYTIMNNGGSDPGGGDPLPDPIPAELPDFSADANNISIRSISQYASDGRVNVTAAATPVYLPVPLDVVRGDVIVIAVVYQTLYGTGSFVAPEGFKEIGSRPSSASRAIILYAKQVLTQADEDLTQIRLVAGASSTRVAAVLMCLTGVDAFTPLEKLGVWAEETPSVASLEVPSVTGITSFTFTFSNGAAGSGTPVHDSATGSKILQVTSLEGTATTALTVFRNSTSPITFTPPATNAGGLRVSFAPTGAGSIVKVKYNGTYHNATLAAIKSQGVLHMLDVINVNAPTDPVIPPDEPPVDPVEPHPTEPSGTPSPNLFYALATTEQAAATPKKVFAHYFGPYPITFSNDDQATDYYSRNYLAVSGQSSIEAHHTAYGGLLRDRPISDAPYPGSDAQWRRTVALTDIDNAIAGGIDGFYCNVMGGSGQNWDRYMEILNAAAQDRPGFFVIPMIDANGSIAANTADYIADRIYTFYGKPSTYITPDGRMLLGSFRTEGKPLSWWQAVIAAVKTKYNVDVAFVGVYNTYSSASAYTSIQYASGPWGIGSDPAVIANSTAASQARARGEKWHAPIWPENIRPNQFVFDEARNTEAYRAGWNKAISDDADIVQLCTWSDYSEGSHVSPSRMRGHVLADIAGYYIARLKTGVFPPILRDALYVSYRNQMMNATITGPQTQFMTQRSRGGMSAIREQVEILSFLTAPATITVTVGGIATTYTAPAGMSAKLVAMRPGKVDVVAKRSTTTIAQVKCPVQIKSTSINQDRQYCMFGSIRGTDEQYDPTPGSIRATWPADPGAQPSGLAYPDTFYPDQAFPG